MSFTFYEFFAGGGMARVGLGPAWRCAFANDVDAVKARAYAANHGSGALVVGDVRKIAASELPGRVDLAWASFPCQDLSLAGKGSGLDGARSGTFWAFCTLMRTLAVARRAPRIIALENVTGVLTSKDGQDFATLIDAIASLGYRVGALVVDAIDYVPQSRPRLFVIAVADDVTIPASALAAGPTPRHPEAMLAARGKLSHVATRRWVWWNLTRIDAPRRRLADVIEASPGGVAWHSEEETRYLLSLMSPRNRAKVAAERARGDRRVGAVYRRTRRTADGERAQRAEVRFDGVSGCLRTPGGGSSRQTILIVEGNSLRSRLLAPREAARLMGLPDSYLLPDRYNQAYHLLGDGVVAPIVRHLATEIIEPALSDGGSRRAIA
ncbi:MAG: DNA cytosine methyltransferase [Hyphomicrobium sp.]